MMSLLLTLWRVINQYKKAGTISFSLIQDRLQENQLVVSLLQYFLVPTLCITLMYIVQERMC